MLDIRALIPERSIEDILAGVVRVRIGGEFVELPVLSRAKNRRWIASLDADLTGLLSAVDASADAASVMRALGTADDALFELLVSYDETGALPPRDELDERIRPNELLVGVLGVWRAANPLADIGFLMAGQTPLVPSMPPSSPPRPTAGRRASSKRKSPTSSTSSISTPPSTVYAESRSNG